MRETDSVVSTISDSRATVETSSSSNDERKRGGQRSFSSPYAAATLDEIPTPILNLLIVLGPYTRHFRKLCQVIAWEKAYSRQSTLLVLLWIVVCLWTNQLLTFGLPPLIAYKVCNDWVNVRTSKVRREKLERKRLAQQRQCEKREKDKNDTDDDDEDDDHYYDNDDSERFRQQKSKQYQEEEEDLVSRKFQSHDHVSLDDTLHDLAIINDYVDRFRYKLRWLADRLNGSRPENLTVVLSILVFVWPSWLILNWLLGTRGVLAIAGSCLLVSLSPWFEVTVTTVKRNALVTHITTAIWAYSTACVLFALFSLVPQRFLVGLVPVDRKPANQPKSWFSRLRDIARRNKAEAMNIIKKLQDEEEKQEQHQKSPGTRSEMIFQFEVYENQRWWLGMEWTNNTMPSERGPWTDVQLAPIASKEELQLPESSQRVEYKSAGSDGQLIKQIITKTWSWADGDWWVDMTGEMQGRVDRNGWEYGNNSWQQMSGQPGMQKFTRRRRWCRRAKLVERRVDEKI